MVALLPMSPAEFNDYLDKGIRNYSAEKVKAGAWPEKDADRLAVEAFDKLLPRGLDTENQHLYSITDEANGNRVGIIWIGVKDRSPERGAWIWDFVIFEQHRRKGYATEALRALDRVLSSMNIDSVSLHVFGHNTAAIALYEKYGFRSTDINMTRAINR
jgi:ribosomal protein S18 acetylase RimI-like enzyme